MISGRTLAVVIPAYRVERQIASVISRIPTEVDIVFVVDDACPDGTAMVVGSLRDSRVRLIRHEKNQGVGGAMASGFRAALAEGADIIVKCDGDGQMDPQQIPRLVAPLVSGQADYTKGCRFYHFAELRAMPRARFVGNIGLTFLTKLASGYWHVLDPQNGFVAIRSDFLQRISLETLSRGYFFENDMLIRLNCIEARVLDVPMPARYGDELSSLNPWRILVSFPARLLAGFFRRIFWRYLFFDVSPVAVFFLAGLALALFGAVFGSLHWIQNARLGRETPTGTVILAAVPFILGAQLLLQALVLDIQNSPRPAAGQQSPVPLDPSHHTTSGTASPVTGSLRYPDSQSFRSPWLLPSLGIAALWALFVAVRFALLKELHLPQLFEAIGQRLPFVLGAFAAAAAVGFLTGFLLPVGLRRGGAATWKVVLGLPVLLALGTASFFLTRRTLEGTSDGTLVVTLIVLASIAGAGFSVGVRFSGRPIHRGLFALLLALPVLAVGAIGRELLTLGACLAILLTAHAVGGWILAGIRAIGSEEEHLDSEPVVTVGLGLVALSAVTFVLGLAGAASRTGLLLLLAVSLIGALRTIPSTAGRIRRFLTGPAVLPSPVFAATAFALATLLAAFLVAAVAPEVGSDALGFRVAGPARFVESGGFSPEPFSIWSYGMIGGEVLYSLFLPLFGFSVAKIVSLLLAATVLVSVSVRLLGTDGFAAGGPWLLALFTSTLVWWQFAWGFVDILQAFFYFGCLAAVRLWMANRGRTGWLFAAGLLGGTATAIKLNGAGSIAIAAFIVLFLTVGRDRDVARALRSAGAAAAGAAVVIGPYLLRSWWYTQNPVFPFVNRIFPSPLAPPEMPRVSFGVGLKMPDVLTLPWQLFFGPTRFIETTGYNPALLASAGLALIVLALSRRTTGVWFTAAVFSGLAWVVTEQNARYSLFVALFFVVGLVTGLPDLTQRLGRGARSALNAGSLVIVLLGFAGHVLLPDFWLGNGQSGPLFPIDFLKHSIDREAYLTVHVPTFRTAQFANDALGSSATVAQLNVRDHLYFRFSTFSFPHSIWPVTQLLRDVYLGSRTPEAILDDLKAAGITHMLVDMGAPLFAQTADSQRKGFFAPEFVARRLQLEFADRGLRLYRLLDADHPEKNVPISMSINLLALANTAPASQPRDIEVEVPVQGGTLYRVRLDRAPADGQPDSQLRVIWRDSSRKLLLFEALAVPESRNGGEYQTFQTAPPKATLAIVQTKNLPLRAARIAPGER